MFVSVCERVSKEQGRARELFLAGMSSHRVTLFKVVELRFEPKPSGSRTHALDPCTRAPNIQQWEARAEPRVCVQPWA